VIALAQLFLFDAGLTKVSDRFKGRSQTTVLVESKCFGGAVLPSGGTFCGWASLGRAVTWPQQATVAPPGSGPQAMKTSAVLKNQHVGVKKKPAAVRQKPGKAKTSGTSSGMALGGLLKHDVIDVPEVPGDPNVALPVPHDRCRCKCSCIICQTKGRCSKHAGHLLGMTLSQSISAGRGGHLCEDCWSQEWEGWTGMSETFRNEMNLQRQPPPSHP
jgi:hypothetical protein